MAPSRATDDTPNMSLPERPRSRSFSQLDPSLRHFADPSFDPVDYLNDTLPPLTLASSQPHASRPPNSIPLSELSSRTQSLLSQLSAQNARLSNSLTQLTDEILRSSGRLTYEVEVLRGETVGLSDALTDGLQNEISKFVTEGLVDSTKSPEEAEKVAEGGETPLEETGEDATQTNAESSDPRYIKQLRTLSQVRARLEDVIHTFGEAMEWTLPPSEVSLTASFISVSAPEPGPESHSREEKGREYTKKLRTQVTELLDSDGGGEAGLEAADRRVQALRLLANVWKGTAEEKARNKLVDGLAKIVEDRRRVLDSQSRERERREQQQRGTPVEQSPRRAGSRTGRPSSVDQQNREERSANGDSGPGGLFRNLQRLRDEIYLD
ncbi:hypothetical protein FQN54_008426 [Arachnomyces sp. PD_36]|nr:hypothetical protein FQN54_008426 [Arachnomyces sp. PD_36]